MNTSNNDRVSPPVTPVPVGDIMLQPSQWAKEAQVLAADYAGMPESTIFLNFARRFTALARALEPR